MFGGSEINKLPNKTEFYLQINHCFNSFRDLQGGCEQCTFLQIVFPTSSSNLQCQKHILPYTYIQMCFLNQEDNKS